MPVTKLQMECNIYQFNNRTVQSEFVCMKIPKTLINVKWQLQLKEKEVGTKYEIYVGFKSCWNVTIDAIILFLEKYMHISCSGDEMKIVGETAPERKSAANGYPTMNGLLSINLMVLHVSNSDMTKNLMMDFTRTHFSYEELGDVKIRVAEEDILAHKCILAAQSPVFAAMLRKNAFKEGQENIINIDDVSAPIVKEMLKFITTGALTAEGKTMAKDLLIFADKYQMSDLKKLCGREIVSSLTKENARDTLKLGVIYNSDFIVERIICFLGHDHL